MADGHGYSKNANAAAARARAGTCSETGCPDCEKQGLPILLTIPTLADKKYAAKVAGTIKPLLKDAPVLSESGYAMRALREGYVMAYYEKPPATLADDHGWTVARVHKGGYMTGTSFAALGVSSKTLPPLVSARNDSFSCSRIAGYASALLFVIPHAEKAGKVWLAFSSHPWSPGVRQRYAGSEDLRKSGMTLVDASQGTSAHAVPLTVDNVRKSVVDFDPGVDLEQFNGNPYPVLPPESKLGDLAKLIRRFTFLRDTLDQNARPEDAPNVYAQADVALGTAGKLTMANAMIVGLADPEGCTTTASQRRITRCNSAAEWVKHFRDDKGVANGQWRLQSALTVKGLLKIFDEQASTHVAQEAKYDASLRGQTCTQAKFAELKAAGKLPPDATLARVPEFDTPMARGQGQPTGWHEEIAFPADWAINMQRDRLKEQVTERLTGKAKRMDWQGFLTKHEQKTKADHDLLVKVELDHKAWLQSALFKQWYTHNFDDTDPRDGVPYAGGVSRCLMGGPITKEALAWWKDFLASDPSAKNNLLVRAMLGNQASFFGWLSNNDQVATAYDEARGLLDVVAAARKKGGHATDQQAEGFAQSLLGTAGALAARMDAAKELSASLRNQLQRLGLGLIAKSESDLFLYKLRVPVGVAGKLWRSMADTAHVATTKTLEKGGRKVKSLVLGGAMALELEGSPKSANALVDVYLWSRGKAKLTVGKVDGQFKLTTTEVLGEGQTPFATALSEDTAEALAKNSMRLMRGAGSGLLSAGSGYLQVLILGAAWKQFEHGTEEDQKAAALTLLTSGIGIGAACMEISGAFAKQLEKEAVEKGLKLAAGYASAMATVVVAIQSFVSAYQAGAHGDDNAAAMLVVQGLFFTMAAGAGLMAVGTATGTAASGMEAAAALTIGGLEFSWTGIGLIFTALGVITGFVILIMKDTPLESWAAESIWGKASDKYASLGREQGALNEVLIGAEVDFSYGTFAWGTMLDNLAANSSPAMGHPGIVMAPANAKPPTLEARLSVILPKAVKNRLPWLLSIHANRIGKGPVELARWGSMAPASLSGDSPSLGLYDAGHGEDKVTGNDKATALTLSVHVDPSQYRNVQATVCVADGSTDAKDVLEHKGSYIIDCEHLAG